MRQAVSTNSWGLCSNLVKKQTGGWKDDDDDDDDDEDEDEDDVVVVVVVVVSHQDQDIYFVFWSDGLKGFVYLVGGELKLLISSGFVACRGEGMDWATSRSSQKPR